jgi:Fur family ferric uptake transcriptional regulator
MAAISRKKAPVTAADIFAGLKKTAALSTVYRALEFLESEGLVESLSLNCKGHEKTRVYFSTDKPHRHFIHCGQCHKFTVFNGCLAGQLQKNLEKNYRCKITNHVFYFTGICEKCLKKNRGPEA